MSELAERLGEMEVGNHVAVTLEDGTTFEGRADPIDYVPETSLRAEVRPENVTTERYEIRSEYDDGWDAPRVRYVDVSEADAAWEQLGTVEAVEVGDEGEDAETA